MQEQLKELRVIELLDVVRKEPGLEPLHLPSILLLRKGVWATRASILGLLPQLPPGCSPAGDAVPPNDGMPSAVGPASVARSGEEAGVMPPWPEASEATEGAGDAQVAMSLIGSGATERGAVVGAEEGLRMHEQLMPIEEGSVAMEGIEVEGLGDMMEEELEGAFKHKPDGAVPVGEHAVGGDASLDTLVGIKADEGADTAGAYVHEGAVVEGDSVLPPLKGEASGEEPLAGSINR
jgi:hypothetical protein